MSVLMLMRCKGDAAELAKAYDVEMQHELPSNQPSRKFHACVPVEDGLLFVDLWDSQEALDAMVGDPEFQANYRSSGLPDPASVEVHQVHNVVA